MACTFQVTYQSFNYVSRAVGDFMWTSWLFTAINFQVSREICLGITKCKDLYTVLCRLLWNVLDEAQWRIQKILVGGDLKHKTSKIRMSSPKLRVIFWPKSEIQTFFSPKFRWSPKKKKKKGLHQN